eukprot:TRINITY_DN5213_c3_g1_i1.p2 TRINITY_DN5213_c3_g1~~TRINITY_DN5213_c3_g1_i1.p2  ORF type:complete len:256 (+),score=72.54 TRINITY_DN5213_c3_g1_i1:492-1259(+)
MRSTLSIVEHGEYRPPGATKPVKLDPDRRRLRRAVSNVERVAADVSPPRQREHTPRVRLLKGDSLSAARVLCAENPGQCPAVLDFASDSNPGGGARGGQVGTQEEEMCRCSSLLVSLEQPGLYPIPDGGAVYAPDIVVFRDRRGELLPEPFWIGVVAAALRWGCDAGEEPSAAEMRRVEAKCRCVLAVAARRHKSVVLGAWGCGAFGGNAVRLAETWRRVLPDYPMQDVVFAVPGGENFEAFNSVFAGAERMKAD